MINNKKFYFFTFIFIILGIIIGFFYGLTHDNINIEHFEFLFHSILGGGFIGFLFCPFIYLFISYLNFKKSKSK